MRFSPLYGAMALVFTSPLYAQEATSRDDELIVSATRTRDRVMIPPGHKGHQRKRNCPTTANHLRHVTNSQQLTAVIFAAAAEDVR
jgi:hypothetical protein